MEVLGLFGCSLNFFAGTLLVLHALSRSPASTRPSFPHRRVAGVHLQPPRLARLGPVHAQAGPSILGTVARRTVNADPIPWMWGGLGLSVGVIVPFAAYKSNLEKNAALCDEYEEKRTREKSTFV